MLKIQISPPVVVTSQKQKIVVQPEETKKVAMCKLGSERLIQIVDQVAQLLLIDAFFFGPHIWGVYKFEWETSVVKQPRPPQWFHRLG